MAYLFLSFSENIDNVSKNQKDLYNLSLKEQYALLKTRHKEIRDVLFVDFINNCFPTGLNKKYYISCPNFLREKKKQIKELNF